MTRIESDPPEPAQAEMRPRPGFCHYYNADDAPAPDGAAEQVGAVLADPGDAVLPAQNADPFQHLQRFGHRAAGHDPVVEAPSCTPPR